MLFESIKVAVSITAQRGKKETKAQLIVDQTFSAGASAAANKVLRA